MIDIKIIADEADMIVNGYAFKRCKEGYRVLNLNRPDRATVLSLLKTASFIIISPPHHPNYTFILNVFQQNEFII